MMNDDVKRAAAWRDTRARMRNAQASRRWRYNGMPNIGDDAATRYRILLRRRHGGTIPERWSNSRGSARSGAVIMLTSPGMLSLHRQRQRAVLCAVGVAAVCGVGAWQLTRGVRSVMVMPQQPLEYEWRGRTRPSPSFADSRVARHEESYRCNGFVADVHVRIQRVCRRQARQRVKRMLTEDVREMMKVSSRRQASARRVITSRHRYNITTPEEVRR